MPVAVAHLQAQTCNDLGLARYDTQPGMDSLTQTGCSPSSTEAWVRVNAGLDCYHGIEMALLITVLKCLPYCIYQCFNISTVVLCYTASCGIASQSMFQTHSESLCPQVDYIKLERRLYAAAKVLTYTIYSQKTPAAVSTIISYQAPTAFPEYLLQHLRCQNSCLHTLPCYTTIQYIAYTTSCQMLTTFCCFKLICSCQLSMCCPDC